MINNYDTLSNMLENVHEGVYFVDLNSKITFWNKGAEQITGFASHEVLGMHCHNNILNHVDDFGNHICVNGCPLRETMRDGKPRNMEVYLHHKLGHRVRVALRAIPIVDEFGIAGCVEMFSDITENKNMVFANKYTDEELKKLALYDQLTGLPNRRYIENFIMSKISEFKNLEVPFGLAFMDIDNFRDFNNNFGHELGDEVLQTVAKTYMAMARQEDLIGRWGGEEFIYVFSNVNKRELGLLCEKMRMLVENSIIRKDGKEHRVTISVGASIISENDDMNSIVKRADKCMYQSKSEGKNRVTID